MSEFEQSGYQTTPEGNEPSIQQEQTQETVPATTQEQSYFEVKYNKENVQVPYEQAPDYIQKGLNYDKVSQRASEYENHLNRVARLSGYQSHDEMIQELDRIEQEQQRQQYLDNGIDPDLFNQLLEQHPDIQFARQQRSEQQQQQLFQQQVNELFSEFPNLKPEEIPNEAYVLNQQGVPLLDAYLRTSYKNLAQQSEQQAIQKLQQNQITSPGSLSGGDVSHKTNISSMGSQDFNSLVDRVLRGEIKNL
jgi:hypothetical protein